MFQLNGLYLYKRLAGQTNQNMKKLRKAFIVSVMAVTVLAMSVVTVPNAGAAASAGDLIKMSGLSSVYYLAADGKRYVFPNESTYKSWYDDFSGVMTISQSELESYPLGKNVTVRPGTKLVKITTNPAVYAVETGGNLVKIASESAAATLYGADWAKRVIDVADSFFTNYNVTGEELDGTAYPAGSLIKTADAATVYYIDADGKARKIADEAAMKANRFNNANVLTSTLAIPTAGDDITGVESALVDTASGAGGVAGAGSGLTVSLASDTAEAANIPAGSPNPFLKLNLTASNDGPVSVSSIKLRAYELGAATNIDNVTFYNNGVKIGTARDINSDKEATFNFSTPIEVAAGTTKSLLVKATIAAGQSGNYALGVANASDVVTTGGATVSGTFPVRGALQAIVTGTNIGTITMSNVGTSDTTNNFGDDNVLLASFDLTAANEPVIFESMRMKNGGTNTAGIVGNMRVLIDGDEVVDGVELVDKFANFNLSNNVIAKNDTVTVEVYGDLGIANVNNTIDLYFDAATDLVFTGQDYGFGIQVAAAGYAGLNNVSDGIVVTLAAGDVTMDMDKSATPARDVRPGDNDVVLATIKVRSAGENATITALGTGGDTFYISGTGLSCNELNNVELKDTSSGAVYDITIATSTGTATYCALSISDEIVLAKGVTKTFQLRADLGGSTNTNAADSGDTYQVTLASTAFTITGDDSDASLQSSITPTSISSAIATVKTSSLIWQTTALTNKTIVPGAKDIVVYSAGLETGASSAVTLTSVKISATTTVATAFDDNNISQLKLYIDGKLVKTVAGGITEAVVGSAAGYINFTSLDTANRVIPAGKSVNLEVKADFSASFSPAGYIQLGIANGTNDIVAKDIDNNNVVESVSNVGTLSRTVILTTVGTLKVELTVTDQKSNANTIVLAGGKLTSGDKYVGKLTFTTANEPIKVKTLVLENMGSATANDILTVDLYDKDGVLVKSKAVSTGGHANFNDLNLILSADNAHEYFVGITAKGINAENDPSSTATYLRTAIYTLASSTNLTALGITGNAVTASGVDSGTSITSAADTNGTVVAGEYASWGFATSTTATITGSLLTAITNPMSNTTLTNGIDQTIGKYTFNFDNGSNRNSDNTMLKAQLVQLILTVATSSGVSVSNFQAYIEGDSANKTTNTAISTNGTVTITLTQLPDTTEVVDGTITLIIEGDITGVTTSGYVQTKINSLSTDFTYNGNHGTGTNISNALLTYTEVQGAKLSN